MTLILKDPQKEINQVVLFIRQTFQKQKIRDSIITVSGGIDSGLSLTLLTKALGKKHVYVLLLPYHNQPCVDAFTLCAWNKIPKGNIKRINIGSLVDSMINTFAVPVNDRVRRGNIMARTRMIAVFDLAKKKHALVCGTENKSEKFLGYFTRFGDGASDIEPLQQWYKTQIQQLAQFLHLPQQIINKAPSAGLWEGQTDEAELGFSYAEADLIIDAYVHKKIKRECLIAGIRQRTVDAVIKRITSQQFKQDVPYVRETTP